MSEITLEWDFESASVIEQKDGRFFEIGTVTLKLLAWAIVGCTYYHHLLPISEEDICKERRSETLERARNEIWELHREHPEISVKHLRLDHPKHPCFYDVAIELQFGVPLLFSDPYQKKVLETIFPYTQLLKKVYNMELKGRHDYDLASSEDAF